MSKIFYFKEPGTGALIEATMAELLTKLLKDSNFRLDNVFEESFKTVGIVQDNTKGTAQITVNLGFSSDGNTIEDVKVYSSEIKKIIDDENMSRII